MIFKWYFIIILIISNYSVYGQYINIKNGANITNLAGDETRADWSNDSKSILFHKVHNGKSDIYLYMLESDSLFNLSNQEYNFRNPVWHPDGDKVIFDSDIYGSDYLYLMDLITSSIRPLFTRDIKCRNASFSASARQVYFTGYDELARSWEIYSYDFVYNNLNKLTDYKLGCSDPDVSDNGKQIVYSKANPFKGTESFEVINWYGESEITFDSLVGANLSWGPLGLKLFFVSDMESENKELYSIWKDGSHRERLTVDEIEIAFPVVSPDGTKIALSVLTKSGWDIFILSFNKY